MHRLQALALGQVADRAQEDHPLGQLDRRERHLQGEALAALPPAPPLGRGPDAAGLPGLQVAPQRLLVGLPVFLGHQDGEGLAEDLVLLVAEGPLGGGVEERDQSLLVGHHDRVEVPSVSWRYRRSEDRRAASARSRSAISRSSRVLARDSSAVRSSTRRSSSSYARFRASSARLPRGPRAEGDDAVAQVVGQLPQELHLVLVERVGLGGIDGQGPQDLGAGEQGDADHGGVAAPEGLRRQGAKSGSWVTSRKTAGSPGPDRLAHRAVAAFRVGPRHVDRLEIALLVAGVGDGADRLRLVPLGVADPAEAIAGDLDDDVAELPEEFELVAGPDQGLPATAEGPAGPIDPPTLAALHRQGFVGGTSSRVRCRICRSSSSLSGGASPVGFVCARIVRRQSHATPPVAPGPPRPTLRALGPQRD